MLICPSCAHENPEGQKFCGECGTKLAATPVREERKVITAVFCDLVGSTALGESMDHEDIARLLERYQRLCREPIESHGGVVEKFIGDAVVGVFGVPAAHEDDPERAVRAALRIVADIGSSDLPIEVRIGINTGEALVRLDVDPRSGEGFATGDTMNTAARLEAAAPVMGVAVGARTRVASERAIVYEELAPIAAKGKAEPVEAWRAIRSIARVGTSERDRTPFVGREPELFMLTQLFDRSRSGPSTLFVTIIADAGLGKSRLVRELGRHVESFPELVVWREGRCLPYGDGISFWALGEIVKAHAGILESDDQGTISHKLDQTIIEPDGQVNGWIKDRLAPLVGLETTTEPPQREEAFTAWRRFLESLASEAPTVLVVEDLHWADDAFVAFLAHVVAHTTGVPLLVVVTARPEVAERHPGWPPASSTVLKLSPLGDADVEAMVAASLPDASAELTRIVLERAGGSPLFAEQLAALVTERALPVTADGVDESLIPLSVQALIAARIDALPPAAKRVLMKASVVGKTFWDGALEALGERADLGATLAELCRRELCRAVHSSTMDGDAEFSFWHALVRDVAYAELTKAERARMHAVTARWIADRAAGAVGEDAEIVVHHLDRALEFAPSAPELDTDVLTRFLADALLAGGESAMRTDAKAADELLRRAIDLSADDARSARAMSLRGRSLLTMGRIAEAQPLLERALDSAMAARDFDEAAQLAIQLGSALASAGHTTERTREPEERVLEAMGSVPSHAKARLLGDLAADEAMFGNPERAEELCAEGVAICDELGVPEMDRLLIARGSLRLGRGDLEGERDLRAAADQLLELGYPASAAGVLSNIGSWLEIWVGTQATPIHDEVIALCEERGVGDVESSRLWRLWVAFGEGRWDELDPLSGMIDRAREVGNVYDESLGLIVLGSVELERTGRVGVVEELVRLSETWDHTYWLTGLGGALLARLQEPTARSRGVAVLRRIAAEVEDRMPRGDEVKAAIAAADVDLGRALLRDPDAFPEPLFRASACSGAGAVAASDGQWDVAANHHADAVGLLDRLGYSDSLPDDRIRLGRCLIRLGRTREGVERLREARTVCERLRADTRIAEIDELLLSVD